MAKKPISIILILALAACQFACVSYVEKTRRVSIDTAESLSYRQDVKDTIVLEIITHSGERITFHNVPPAQIRGDYVEGFATLAKDLEISREDIAVISEESPERMTVRSTDGSVYYFDQYTREGDVINGKGQIRTKLPSRWTLSKPSGSAIKRWTPNDPGPRLGALSVWGSWDILYTIFRPVILCSYLSPTGGTNENQKNRSYDNGFLNTLPMRVPHPHRL